MNDFLANLKLHSKHIFRCNKTNSNYNGGSQTINITIYFMHFPFLQHWCYFKFLNTICNLKNNNFDCITKLFDLYCLKKLRLEKSVLIKKIMHRLLVRLLSRIWKDYNLRTYTTNIMFLYLIKSIDFTIVLHRIKNFIFQIKKIKIQVFFKL